MKKILFSICLLLLSFITFCQTKNEQAIRKVLEDQLQAWNNGNIDEYMRGYWKNDSLMFIGKSGIIYGYENALKNYKKSYKDATQMGKLFFEIVQVKPLSTDTYFVVGKWFIKRSMGDTGGAYTLLFKKINGRWVIVADHSS